MEAFRDAPYGISSDPLLGRQDLLGVVDGLRVIIIGRSRVIGGVNGHVISHVASCSWRDTIGVYSGARTRQARRGGGGKRALTLNVVATRCEGASANTSTGDSSVTNLLFYRLTVTDVSPEVRTTPLCQSFASQAL